MHVQTHIEPATLHPDKLRAWVAEILESSKMSADDARIVADVLVAADERGVHSHGVRFLPKYVGALSRDAIRAWAKPRVVRETPVTALMDGDAGFGHLVAFRAAEVAIAKARATGVAIVLVRNSNHFGAAGYYALQCADAGLCAMVMSNVLPIMAGPGTGARVVGNSPIALAVPGGDGELSIVTDIALSQVAAQRVVMAAERDELVPDSWLVDGDGTPSNNPLDFIAGIGALRPIGDHKGYGLAVFVEIVAGVLSGAAFTKRIGGGWTFSEPSDLGHAIIAFDIEPFMSRSEFADRLRSLIDELHAAPAAAGADGILLPGEIERREEDLARVRGVELDAVTWQGLVEFADAEGCLDTLRAAQA